MLTDQEIDSILDETNSMERKSAGRTIAQMAAALAIRKRMAGGKAASAPAAVDGVSVDDMRRQLIPAAIGSLFTAVEKREMDAVAALVDLLAQLGYDLTATEPSRDLLWEIRELIRTLLCELGLPGHVDSSSPTTIIEAIQRAILEAHVLTERIKAQVTTNLLAAAIEARGTVAGQLTRDQAIYIARAAARKHPQSYMPQGAEDFEPHEWVIAAIMAAAQLAVSPETRAQGRGRFDFIQRRDLDDRLNRIQADADRRNEKEAAAAALAPEDGAFEKRIDDKLRGAVPPAKGKDE